MPLTIAVQLDPPATLKVQSDSTLALMEEAHKRRHQLAYYTPQDAFLSNSTLFAKVTPCVWDAKLPFPLKPKKAPYVTPLEAFNIILMRQDPPFNMEYITYTYLLEMLPPSTLVVNNPREVRNCPEKLFACTFAHLMPPTLISQDKSQLKDFLATHKDVILKPLYGHAGNDILRLKHNDTNIDAIITMMLHMQGTPLIAQTFLPRVLKGDKRVILIDGKPAGAVNRKPAKGEIRSNLALGGIPEKATLNRKEKKICDILGPELVRRGIVFAGIDIIDGYLTEINITSPTGIRIIDQLNGSNISEMFWDAVEGRKGGFRG